MSLSCVLAHRNQEEEKNRSFLCIKKAARLKRQFQYTYCIRSVLHCSVLSSQYSSLVTLLRECAVMPFTKNLFLIGSYLLQICPFSSIPCAYFLIFFI